MRKLSLIVFGILVIANEKAFCAIANSDFFLQFLPAEIREANRVSSEREKLGVCKVERQLDAGISIIEDKIKAIKTSLNQNNSAVHERITGVDQDLKHQLEIQKTQLDALKQQSLLKVQYNAALADNDFKSAYDVLTRLTDPDEKPFLKTQFAGSAKSYLSPLYRDREFSNEGPFRAEKRLAIIAFDLFIQSVTDDSDFQARLCAIQNAAESEAKRAAACSADPRLLKIRSHA